MVKGNCFVENAYANWIKNTDKLLQRLSEITCSSEEDLDNIRISLAKVNKENTIICTAKFEDEEVA